MQLYLLASFLENEDGVKLSKLSEPELFYYILEYMKSKRLGSLENAGMSRLLCLQDTVNEMTTVFITSEHSSSSSPVTVPVLSTHSTHKEDIPTLPTNSNDSLNVSGSRMHIDQVVGISDMAAFFSHRQFKIQVVKFQILGQKYIYYIHIPIFVNKLMRLLIQGCPSRRLLELY